MSREEALLQTPEHGLATLWRHARQLLAGPERLAVMAADSETLELAEGFGGAHRVEDELLVAARLLHGTFTQDSLGLLES